MLKCFGRRRLEMGMWTFAENEYLWASNEIIWCINGKGGMAFLDVTTDISTPEFPTWKAMPICYKRIINQSLVIIFKLLPQFWNRIRLTAELSLGWWRGWECAWWKRAISLKFCFLFVLRDNCWLAWNESSEICHIKFIQIVKNKVRFVCMGPALTPKTSY